MAIIDSLISFWRLNEASGTRVDAHSSNDLDDNFTVLGDIGVVGGSNNWLYDSSLFVTANTEYLSHADNADLSTGDIDFSVAFWVRRDAIASLGIVTKGETSNREWKVNFDNATDKFILQIWDSGDSSVGLVYSDNYIQTNADIWAFVVAWHDEGADTVNIQVNNGTATSAATTGVPSNTTSDFYIGRTRSNSGYTYLSGAAQMVGFWKKILSTAEKTQLWNSGLGLDYPFTDAVFTGIGEAVATNGYSKEQHNATGAAEEMLAQWTNGGTTYEAITYWDEDDKLVIGKRVAAGAWTLYTYDGTSGLPNIALSGDDAHDRVTLGFDPNGIIHVCYDMHNESLKYAKSDAAISSWTGGLSTGLSMLGTNEASVSYPTFFNDPAGTLYFMFRDGVSGNGDLFFYEYDESGPSWGSPTGLTAGKLVQGKTGGVYNPYWSQPPVFDSDFGSGGFMHAPWIWRDLGANNFFDVCYVRWDGTNWEQADGTSQTIPITTANDEVIDAVSTASGLSAFPRVDSDSDGNPHIVYYKDDGSSYAQVYYVYHNGTIWSSPLALTSSTESYFAEPVQGQPGLAINRTNDIVYVFITGFGETAGIYYYYSDNFTSFTKATLTTTPVGRWIFNYNRQHWLVDDELQMAIAAWNGKKQGDQVLRIYEVASSMLEIAAGLPERSQPRGIARGIIRGSI